MYCVIIQFIYKKKKKTQTGKELVSDLNHDGIEFSVREKDFSKIETKNNISINVFCYENKLVFSIHNSDQEFKNSIDIVACN